MTLKYSGAVSKLDNPWSYSFVWTGGKQQFVVHLQKKTSELLEYLISYQCNCLCCPIVSRILSFPISNVPQSAWKPWDILLAQIKIHIKHCFKCCQNDIYSSHCTYLRNIKHFPCWHTVISTRVEIGKTRNCEETRRPLSSVFLYNFECFYTISTSM